MLRLSILILICVGSCLAQLPSITTTALPNATTGGAYSAVLSASGGVPPYSNWTVGAGSFPPGLTLDAASGRISGTPSASGVFNFFVTVTDSAGGISPAQALSITTSSPVITTTTASLPNAVVNSAYSATLTPSGGTPPYSNWIVSAGALPQGLFLNPATGVIAGTPVIVGAYTFSVTMQDSTGTTSAPQSFTIVTGVSIITNTLPKGTLTAPYSAQLVAGGGLAPYVGWSVSSGALPPGLTLDSATGLVTGTPTAAGSYSFSITVSDSAANVATPQNFTVVIAPVPTITTGALLPGLPGVPYSATLSASGGTLPLAWAITSGTLPVGLTFLPGSGVIKGTPQSLAGTTFNFSVQVTDAVGVTSAPQALSIAISQASLTLAPSSLTFNVNPGDTSQPPVQSVSVFSLASTVTFSATAATVSGGNWLTVAGGGRTPGNLLVSVTTSGLSPNTTYRGSITVSGQNINSATIPVTLVMGVNGPPQLSVFPASLSLNYLQRNTPDQRYLIVNNAGSGTVHFSARATTESCGAGWLNLLNDTGSATPPLPGVIALLVNPAGLSDKICAGAVTVNDVATGQSQQVSVTMNVSAETQSLQLTQSGMSFQTGAGSAPPPQSFSVLNPGVGLVNWTATAQTSSGGSWLAATPSSGSATNGVLPVPVTVTLTPQGLPPGTYHGTVQVASPMVGNGQPSVNVMLTVLNAAPAPPPLSPSGVILVGQSSGTSTPEMVSIFNPWSSPLSFSSTVVTDNRVNWLTQTPASGTVAAGGNASISLQASLKGLSPGLQHGAMRVAFTDGTVHTVDVYVIVPLIAPAPSLHASPELLQTLLLSPEAITQACPGNTGIVVVLRSPEPGFEVTADVPVPVQLMARDCSTGKLLRQGGGPSAQVLVGSRDIVSIPLTDDGTGIWSGTWIPAGPAALINLTARIDTYIGSIAAVQSGQDSITGTVDPAPDSTSAVANVQ